MTDPFSLVAGALDESDYEVLLRDQNFTILAADLANASAEQKRNLLMALQPPIELTDVLPPPNHDDIQVQVMAVGYMLLFLLGTCGNVAVLTTIYQMVRSRRANLDNTLIYMVVLSCVDFGVCLSLPFTVIDQILGFWMFGSTMCKLHAVLENFGKILSALIITAMSFDRFAGVCHSEKRFLRSRRVAFSILIGMTVYALLALSPLLYNFEAREVILFQKATGPNKITRMRIEKCTMVDMVRWTFTLFTCFLFVLCYLVPLFLVAFFYTKLLSKLYHHSRQFKTSQIRSQIPLMRISLYTLAVACFYFICWTPFWVATAFAVYLEYAGESNGSVPPVFVYFMYFIHALPFTNSAVNWILYGALNGQLQQRIRHGTVHGGGGGPLTSVLGRTTQNECERPTMTMTMNGYFNNNHHHSSQHSSQNHLNNLKQSQKLSAPTACLNQIPLLKSMDSSKVSAGCRHSSSIDVGCCTSKRPSISPTQSIQQNNSISSLTLLAAKKERRPSCPASDLELQQIIELNGNDPVKNGQIIGKRYRRRTSSTKVSDQTCLERINAYENQTEILQNGIKPNMNGATDQKEQINHWKNWDYKTNELHKIENYAGRNGEFEDNVDEEELSLLLHSTDSINCLLRIDSESSTFL